MLTLPKSANSLADLEGGEGPSPLFLGGSLLSMALGTRPSSALAPTLGYEEGRRARADYGTRSEMERAKVALSGLNIQSQIGHRDAMDENARLSAELRQRIQSSKENTAMIKDLGSPAFMKMLQGASEADRPRLLAAKIGMYAANGGDPDILTAMLHLDGIGPDEKFAWDRYMDAVRMAKDVGSLELPDSIARAVLPTINRYVGAQEQGTAGEPASRPSVGTTDFFTGQPDQTPAGAETTLPVPAVPEAQSGGLPDYASPAVRQKADKQAFDEWAKTTGLDLSRDRNEILKRGLDLGVIRFNEQTRQFEVNQERMGAEQEEQSRHSRVMEGLAREDNALAARREQRMDREGADSLVKDYRSQADKYEEEARNLKRGKWIGNALTGEFREATAEEKKMAADLVVKARNMREEAKKVPGVTVQAKPLSRAAPKRNPLGPVPTGRSKPRVTGGGKTTASGNKIKVR